VIAHLLADEHPRFGVLVELALGHAPGLLTRLLPRAVRASDYLYRLTGAAVLALLDTDWSRQVLLGVLDTSASQDKTFECRAALRESRDPGARRAADGWEARHPERKPATPVDDRFLYTFSGGVARALRERMGELADAVRQARGRLPVSGE
jgi:hypothetical protein